MRRLRFPIPISIVLFVVLTAVGTYYSRKTILEQTMINAIKTGDDATALQLLKSWPCPVGMMTRECPSPLCWAASAGNRELVERLLAKGLPINELGTDKRRGEERDNLFTQATPMHWAAIGGHADVVRLLLARGADLSATATPIPQMPLNWALSGGNIEVIRILFDAGAPLDNSYGSLDRHFRDALVAGRVDVAQLRHPRGVNLNAVFNDGTALHAAARAGKIRSVEYLLSLGMDVNVRTPDGRTALHLTAARDKAEMIRLLVSGGAEIDARDGLDATPLHLAAGKAAVEALAGAGANIEARRKKGGETPLVLAINEGRTAAAEALVTRGADVNAVSDYGDAPLSNANGGLTRLLIRAGADIEFKTVGEWSVLHQHVYHLRRDSVPVLLEAGANPNVRDMDGATPLHLAAERGYVDMIEPLLSHGADAGLRNKAGKTALMLAEEKGNKAVAEVLRARGAKD